MQLAVTMEEQYIKLQKHTTKYILKHTVKHIFSPSPPRSYPPGQHMNGHSLTNPSRLALSLTHILSPLSPLLLFPSHTLSGQHMNGDEAMAMGAAFRAANLSTAFRVRKVGHTNTPCHTNTRPSITRPVLLTTYHSFSLIPPPPLPLLPTPYHQVGLQDLSTFGVSVRLENLPVEEKKEGTGIFGGLLGGKKKEDKGVTEDAEVRWVNLRHITHTMKPLI